ncbi:MAG: pyridoxal phosphate-dependent decarboxylase family protein [Thermomicrobiales bacterium]
MTLTSDLMKPGAMTLGAEEFRRAGHAAIDVAADYLGGIRDRPVFQPMTPNQRDLLMDATLPERGMNVDDILARFVGDVMPFPLGNGHPRFYGWVNSSPSPVGILADLLAATMNPSCAGGDHSAIYIERAAVRWLMELIGFPTDGSMGLLVSGGSMASLTCLTAARHWATKKIGANDRENGMQSSLPPMTLYLADEGHSCMRKAAELLGIGQVGLRLIPVDASGRMIVTALESAIVADLDAGKLPFCVAGSAGTAMTGAIDALSEIADLCAQYDLWFHVDGAYGALGVLDDRLAERYTGMDRANSVALDPHKWLSVPVECGCALVRDGALLRDTFSLVPSYVRTEEGKGVGGLPWYSEYGFQQSRGFRALKLWMTLLYAGKDGVKAHIVRQNDLARALGAMVDADPLFELSAPVDLSIVCFRMVPEGVSTSDLRLNSFNQHIANAVQSSGEAFVTSGVFNGQTILHANTLNGETTIEDVRELLPAMVRIAAGIED